MIFPTAADLVGVVFGVILTLMVFSYLLGDNPAFRFSIHLFIGVSAGLAGAVAVRNVILPQVVLPLFDPGDATGWLWALGVFLLSLLLFLKVSPNWSRFGNIPMAFIVGVGAAVVISGAILGTIFPQVSAATDLFNLQSLPAEPFSGLLGMINRFVAVTGTVTALAYFHFSARSEPNAPPVRPMFVEYAARVGQVFIAITFGVLFAGVVSAALAAWMDRWNFIVDFLTTLAASLLGS